MNRAFLVGINTYPGMPLRGSVNDVVDMAKFLVDKCGFPEAGIRLLTDARATQAAIVERLGWLLTGVQPGDRLLFHYSGHGAQFPTRNPMGEVDGLDEVICPVDFTWTGERVIRDQDFNRLFAAVPSGVEFVWISDSCHAGDLTTALPPLVADGLHKTIPPPADIDWRLKTAAKDGTIAKGMVESAKGLNLALIAACRSDEISSDGLFDGRASGALTYFLLRELNKPDGLTSPLSQVVARAGAALAGAGYPQHPQIEGSPAIYSRPFLQGHEKKTTPKGPTRIARGAVVREFEA